MERETFDFHSVSDYAVGTSEQGHVLAIVFGWVDLEWNVILMYHQAFVIDPRVQDVLYVH